MRYRVAIPSMIKSEGIMALYKGFLATCLRDIPGWATLFYVNEKLKDKLGVTDAE